jgi:hypothetical protein
VAAGAGLVAAGLAQLLPAKAPAAAPAAASVDEVRDVREAVVV